MNSRWKISKGKWRSTHYKILVKVKRKKLFIQLESLTTRGFQFSTHNPCIYTTEHSAYYLWPLKFTYYSSFFLFILPFISPFCELRVLSLLKLSNNYHTRARTWKLGTRHWLERRSALGKLAGRFWRLEWNAWWRRWCSRTESGSSTSGSQEINSNAPSLILGRENREILNFLTWTYW